MSDAFFGVCDISGNPNNPNAGSFSHFSAWPDSVDYVCPGVGTQNVDEISFYGYLTSGYPSSVFLAVYSADGTTKLAEGTAPVVIGTAEITWQGHIGVSNIIQYAPLVAGVHYKIFVSFLGTANGGTFGYHNNSATGSVWKYDEVEYTSGPSSLPGTSVGPSTEIIVRVGVVGTGGGTPGGPTLATVSPATIYGHPDTLVTSFLTVTGTGFTETGAAWFPNGLGIQVGAGSALSDTVWQFLEFTTDPGVYGLKSFYFHNVDGDSNTISVLVLDPTESQTGTVAGPQEVHEVYANLNSKAQFDVYITDLNNRRGKTGLAFNTPGLTISLMSNYIATPNIYSGSNIENIGTIGTWVEPTTGKIRFKEIDATNRPGWYQLMAPAGYFQFEYILSVDVTDSASPQGNWLATPLQIEIIDMMNEQDIADSMTITPSLSPMISEPDSVHDKLNDIAVAAGDPDAIAAQVWNEQRSMHNTPGSFGEGISSVQGNVTGNIQGSVAAVTGNISGSLLGSLTAAERTAIADALFADTIGNEPSMPAVGAAPTFRQWLWMILYREFNFAIVGTTLSVKNSANVTIMTFTLNSATTPTSIVRAT